MALAQRASPPPSDGSAQGDEDVRAGYLELMDDPPGPCSPVRYAGDYWEFSAPGRGSPLRGEAVAYLASWADRLAAAAKTASAEISRGTGSGFFPQLVWRTGAGSLAWADGAFPAVSAASPRLDLFRLRLLGFLRTLRVPVGVACDESPPEPVSRFADWSWTTDATSGMMQDEEPRTPPRRLDGDPEFAEGYVLASSQAEVDANGGKWLVPCAEGMAGLPFGAGPNPLDPASRPPGDTGPARAALAYMASLSGWDGNPSLRDGGFASRYSVPPPVRPAGGGPRIPDPDFVQEPEPLSASDVRALFASARGGRDGDALGSGRSRVWAGCAGLNLFAALSLRTDPAVKETRWRARVVVECLRWRYQSLVPNDYGGTSDWVDVGSPEPDGAASYGWDAGDVLVEWLWDGAYGGWRATVRPVGLAFGGQGGIAEAVPFDYDVSYVPTESNHYTSRVKIRVSVEMESFERVVEPARTYPVWGSSALQSAPSFRFRSVAKLEETDHYDWYGDHPEPSDSEVAAWFKREFVDPYGEDVETVFGGVGGFSGASEWTSFYDSGGGDLRRVLYDCATGGPQPPDPYTGAVLCADSVGIVRDEPPPGGLASEVLAGLPDDWILGSESMWVVDRRGEWPEGYAGINWARRLNPATGKWEYLDSGAPEGGAGRFDVEYVSSATAAGGAAGPLCPGGTPVPVQSADSVAVLPLFCAEVTVTVRTRKVLSWWTHPWDASAGESYDRKVTDTALETEVRTHYVVGFADRPCSWTRDAGEESAGSSGRLATERPGPDGLWDFVRRRVLAALGFSSAADLLYGSDSTHVLRQTPMGVPSDACPIPHDSYAARWQAWEGGVLVDHDPPPRQAAGEWVPVGDAAEWAEVAGTVEFPFCVYESGYCA